LIDSSRRMCYCSTHKKWENAERFICLYDLFSEIIRLKKDKSKRKLFCFNSASEPLHEDLNPFYFSCDMTLPCKHWVALRIFTKSTVVCISATHMQWLCGRGTIWLFNYVSLHLCNLLSEQNLTLKIEWYYLVAKLSKL
jgi:hypothetical protein